MVRACRRLRWTNVSHALVYANAQRSIFGDLLDSVFGIVFLATPHRGSGVAAPGELASRILRAARFGTATNAELVASLRRDGEMLWDLSSQFVERAIGLQIRTFYETEPMLFMSTLVCPLGSRDILDRFV